MVLEYLEQNNQNLGHFSIERFESVMTTKGVSWDEINSEIGYDAKGMLHDKNKPPMFNLINKACTLLDLSNSDYVMMKSNSPEFMEDNNKVVKAGNGKYISTSNIDLELLDLYVKESEWNYRSLSCIMSKNSVLLLGTNYYKHIKTANINDLYNVCWALKITLNDLLLDNNGKYSDIPERVLNPRQKYILDQNYISRFSVDEINRICKYANVPKWFINADEDVYVSLEMVNKLCSAIKYVTKNSITGSELCTNFNIDDANVANNKIKYKRRKKNMNIPNEVKEAIYEAEAAVEQPTETIQEVSASVNKEYRPRCSGKVYKQSYTKITMKDILNRIDHMSDADIEKIEEYICIIKKQREIKNSV